MYQVARANKSVCCEIFPEKIHKHSLFFQVFKNKNLLKYLL